MIRSVDEGVRGESKQVSAVAEASITRCGEKRGIDDANVGEWIANIGS